MVSNVADASISEKPSDFVFGCSRRVLGSCLCDTRLRLSSKCFSDSKQTLAQRDTFRKRHIGHDVADFCLDLFDDNLYFPNFLESLTGYGFGPVKKFFAWCCKSPGNTDVEGR